VVSRIRLDPNTRAYVARKTAEGHSKLEIIRCLKRYLAHEIYFLLNPVNQPFRVGPTGGAPQPDLTPSPAPPPPPQPPERRRGQGGAPSWTNDLDRAEHRHTIISGGMPRTSHGATSARR
jgi:hypothetical protein